MQNCLGTVLLIATIAMVGGCQETYIRYVSSAATSQDQFMKDRYACYQETQQRVSIASVDQYGGAANGQLYHHAVPSTRASPLADITGRIRRHLADFNVAGNFSVPAGATINCNQ